MSLFIDTVVKVGVHGRKARWEVKHVREVDGQKFAKMASSDNSLARFVLEGLQVDSVGETRFTLNSSDGLHELMEIRNAAQSTLLSPAAAEAAKLFGATKVSPPKVKRLKRGVIKEQRENPSTFWITIPQFNNQEPMDVLILKPIHPLDALWVALEQTYVERVIRFIRFNGFSETNTTRHGDLPAGVRVRKTREGLAYQAVRKSIDGSKKKLQSAKSLVEATELVQKPLEDSSADEGGIAQEDDGDGDASANGTEDE